MLLYTLLEAAQTMALCVLQEPMEKTKQNEYLIGHAYPDRFSAEPKHGVVEPASYEFKGNMNLPDFVGST